MSKISYIIQKGNFELVREKIASILADELYNQYVLISDKLTNDPPINPFELADLQLSLESLPIFEIEDENGNLVDTAIVFSERTDKPGTAVMPFVNVYLTRNMADSVIGKGVQVGDVSYTIEVSQIAKGSDQERGDLKSAKKLQRLLNICWKILAADPYKFLDLDFLNIIGYSNVKDIEIGMPETGAKTTDYEVCGKFDLIVKVHEDIQKNPETLLEANETTLNFNESENYFWVNQFVEDNNNIFFINTATFINSETTINK